MRHDKYSTIFIAVLGFNSTNFELTMQFHLRNGYLYGDYIVIESDWNTGLGTTP